MARYFAAIVIGSSETEMRIYEFNSKKEMIEIDCIKKRISLGLDAYSDHRLDPETVRELCDILLSYKEIMAGYQITDYKVCATSAFREIDSALITRDFVEKQTGMKIQVISNSEQRFLDYKSIASESGSFEEIIRKGTAIVDIGGSSLQISVFDKDKLITTQNIRMGKVTSREAYRDRAGTLEHYEAIITELMDHEMNGFARLYQKERQIINMIVADPDLMNILRRQGEASKTSAGSTDVFMVRATDFSEFYQEFINLSALQLADRYGMNSDEVSLVVQSMIFIKCLLTRLGAETLWLMDVTICDGLAYDFGVKNRLLVEKHHFEDDIIAASRRIAKRYKSNMAHIRNMEYLCLEIFDRMKKIHGMKKRERLLLQISAILHNCGKYISLVNVSDCAYNIIMSTEIIGLSHEERRIIANVIRYNSAPFEDYDDMASREPISRDEYLLIAKLTAILRLANALDRSHRQKFDQAKVAMKEDKLIISVTTDEDLTLEKITVFEKTPFFVEVFNVKPEIRQKKKF